VLAPLLAPIGALVGGVTVGQLDRFIGGAGVFVVGLLIAIVFAPDSAIGGAAGRCSRRPAGTGL